MKIALAQMKMSHCIDENFKKTIKLIRQASQAEADLICFPEIQLTEFFPQYRKKPENDFALTLESEYIKGIGNACKENRIYASPNFYIRENGKNYDMSLLINDSGEIIGNQKMVHIAQAEQFYEQDYYTPSEEGFNVFETKFGRIGMVICFDRHYPESVRTEALRGAELIIIPTANITSEPSQMFQWEIKVWIYVNKLDRKNETLS